MAAREQILQQIRNGEQLVVGRGGGTIRPASDPTAEGVPVKEHTWGRYS